MFIARGKEDALVTLNLVPGEAVYGEKRIAVEEPEKAKIEYRVWNPFRLVQHFQSELHTLKARFYGHRFLKTSTLRKDVLRPSFPLNRAFSVLLTLFYIV